MSKIEWSVAGERFYEVGVDRGVLYPNSMGGVPWNGLVNVSESAEGGSSEALYLDGLKYMDFVSSEAFQAQLDAYSSPAEFAGCDGTKKLAYGLSVTNQPRESFGLSYRTLVGNDLEGTNYGYKIHLVYNATAEPSGRNYKTLSNTADVEAKQWTIHTVPPRARTHRPTAHFVIETKDAPPFAIRQIEDILYGTEATSPRLPTVDELFGMFSSLLPYRLFVESTDAYNLREVDLDQSRAVISNLAPSAPGVNEDPIFWIDTSPGDYAVPRIVTGG